MWQRRQHHRSTFCLDDHSCRSEIIFTVIFEVVSPPRGHNQWVRVVSNREDRLVKCWRHSGAQRSRCGALRCNSPTGHLCGNPALTFYTKLPWFTLCMSKPAKCTTWKDRTLMCLGLCRPICLRMPRGYIKLFTFDNFDGYLATTRYFLSLCVGWQLRMT